MKNSTFISFRKGFIFSLHPKLLLIAALCILLPFMGYTERKYPDMSVSVSSNGSDFELSFSYSGAGVVGCSESVVHKFGIYKNTDSSAEIEYTGSGSKSSGTIAYVAGPSNSGSWGLRYQESEDCSWAWCNCVEWAWSGYPRANSSGDRGAGYSVLTYASTSAIKAPTGITASNQEYYDKIVLNWTEATDIPDDQIQYKIYRGSTTSSRTLVHTASGTERTWTDNTIVPNDEYYYWITTYTSDWGGHESPKNSGNAVLGKAKTFTVDASDGLYTSRVKISWEDLSDFAEEIRVERSVPNSSEKEELDILSKNAQAYSDNEAIPGYNHTYYITPIQEVRTFPSLSDQGYIKPNGTIKGSVKSLLGAGVEGVLVCAVPITPNLTLGALSVPAGGYCTTTDIDGYFEIRNIYYFEEAEFEIVPFKAGPVEPHIFSPDTITRILDLNSKLSSGVNFTDESVFTVGGKVTFPVSSTNVECGVPEVEILFDGESRGIFTDSNGEWSYAIQDEGSYTFQPKFLHHYFENTYGDTSTTVFVNDDVIDIDFTDLQIDSIQVKVQGGCGDPVATSVTVQVTSPGNCFNKNYTTDENGLLMLSDLPAREYSVQVIALNPVNSGILDQIGNKPIVIDLTIRDTAEFVSERDSLDITPADTIFLPNNTMSITPADTVYLTVNDTTQGEVIPKADFIYHSPLQVEVDFADAGAEVLTSCKNSDNNPLILMEQNGKYKLLFDVSEELGDCPIKEGKLKIFDFVSDRGDTPIEIPIVNGFAVYEITAGLPEIAESVEHNHEKLLYVIPEVGFLDATPLEYWVTVTGVKTQAPSFITQSPEMPMLILHDPPGDNSYAYVEKGTTIKSFETHEMLIGGEAGAFANLLIGAKIITPFSSNGFGTLIKFSAVAGRDNFDRDGIETTITFNENFSTSSMDNLTGNDGDVYIGASFNQVFAYGDELSFDYDKCEVKVQAVPTIDVNGFATTFVYTEKHIESTLLPKLAELREDLIAGRDTSQLSEEEKVQANQLLYDIIHWKNVIAQNTANRDTNAVFKKNISFNAGAVYSNEYTSDTTNSTSFEYNTFVNIEFAAGIKIDNESGAWFDSELGVTAKFRWGTTTNTGTDTTNSRKVGYILDDGDIGDFFSVDIKEDVAYGVPAFTLKSGTTSCPHEPGSQPRDDARIQIFPPQINNVPIGGKAVFTANLLNESQSRETREYHVRVISTTNPDGAVVSIGGKQINNAPASFFLDFNQTASIALTVERGPLATTYDSIGIMMFPPCEYALWEDNGNITSGDTAWIFVDFQSDCSNVSLHLPGDGWLVNQNNNDILNVAFSGYDLNNEKLESITLQLKKGNEGWLDVITYAKNELSGNFFDYAFDVSGLPDGSYRLRAKSYCGIEGGISYSSEQSGIIDRTSLAPFGTPSPADGFLRFGQEISVTFDKDINCNFASYNPNKPAPSVKLFLNDSTEIQATIQCSENQDKIIIVPDQDLFTQPDLEGVRISAIVENIQDISGNVQDYKTEWSFLVNVSPVSWNPEEIYRTVVETEDVVLSANLANSAVISKSFTISEWPDWLTPGITSASILSGNSFTIQLTANNDLSPGLYEGQVIALIDDVPEILNVTLELYAENVSWNIYHPDFEYNMNITAQFSSDETDINLSTGLRDKIAAFVDGELRGIGEITYIPELDRYAAFINIASNISGENGSLIEAEDYVDDLSVQDLISVSDDGAISNATRFKKNNWVDFDIYATKNGTFDVEFRLASIKTGNEVELHVDGVLKQTFILPNTGNLSSYTTFATTVQIDAGSHTFRILSKDAEFDLNWINFPEYHVRNAHSTEIIKFRMWDGLNGIEYGAIEELTFFSDGVVGNAIEPFILHPAGGIQEMILAKGWNWISINKQSNDMSVGKIFESITPPTSLNDITLKSQAAYSQFAQETGWLGNLSNIDLESGYMIHLNTHADTLSLIGKAPESDVSITLNPKWNWIGYPKQGILPIGEVLIGLNSNDGDIIKSQTEFAEYNSGTATWIGDLEFFQPGKGYRLFVSSGGNLNIPKSAGTDELSLKHEYNMTVTAMVNFGNSTINRDYDLRTYINGQLRGEIPLTYIDRLNEYMAFSMIYGDRADIGEELNMVLWDRYNQKEIPLSSSSLNFTIDKINGTINQPVILSLLNGELVNETDADALSFKTYPNPFTDETTISYHIPEQTYVLVTITNALGKEILRLVDEDQVKGNYNYVFEAANLVSGTYYCKIQTNEYVETKKLILVKD
ncbi:carbohydrate-binding protein [Prolixibacteraceae bacterium Z1-6]|uniref:Carbohydrate-binding protein n=1 Tax=Draconibacterium aestuarii TaxID=2998507 RepID=A0A9X3FBX6_9BACT|nr:carbohydrate-binding protein [Prolixibacteraceae bacterium Z1-6]